MIGIEQERSTKGKQYTLQETKTGSWKNADNKSGF